MKEKEEESKYFTDKQIIMKKLFILLTVISTTSCSVYPSLSSNFNVPVSEKVNSRVNVNASTRHLNTDFSFNIRGKRSNTNIRIPIRFNN